MAAQGDTATPHAFPFLVALFFYGSFTCGGSLIADTWVLTAAHCVQRVGNFSVATSRHNLDLPAYVDTPSGCADWVPVESVHVSIQGSCAGGQG